MSYGTFLRTGSAPWSQSGIRRQDTPSRPVIRSSVDDGERELVMMRWGLVPAKIADPDSFKSFSTTNARSESILEKPIWKGPFLHSRCLVPVDGFYEGLISPFLNPPTVTVSNQSSIFSAFSIQSFNYDEGTITVAYTVLPTATAGPKMITVNNGFGTDSVNVSITQALPAITSITTPSGVLIAGQTQTVTLTGTNFGTAPPTITVASGTEYVTLISGSVVAPSALSASNASKTMSSVSKISQGAKANAVQPATSGTQQTVSFQVSVSAGAPANSGVTFELQANGGAQNSPPSPILDIQPEPPVQPIILDLLAADNNNVCSGENIGQGASSAQQVVIGQLVAFTACVSNPWFGGFGVPSVALASWTVQTNFTSNAVAGYSLSNYEKNTNFGGFYVPQTAAIVPVQASPNCGGGSPFCDFQSFYFVVPGVYDFVFSYQLNNGTEPLSTTVEYIVSGPTQSPSGVSLEDTSLGLVQILGPGQYGNNPGYSELSFGDPITPGESGITFAAVASSPNPAAPGSYQWVQKIVYRQQQYMTPSNATCPTCFESNVLDNFYPYFGDLASPNTTEDIPETDLQFSTSSGNSLPYDVKDYFLAQMTLMWDPALNPDGSPTTSASDLFGCAASTVAQQNGTVTSTISHCAGGSIPVPLGLITWGYCGEAINTFAQQPTVSQQPKTGTNTWLLGCLQVENQT